MRSEFLDYRSRGTHEAMSFASGNLLMRMAARPSNQPLTTNAARPLKHPDTIPGLQSEYPRKRGRHKDKFANHKNKFRPRRNCFYANGRFTLAESARSVTIATRFMRLVIVHYHLRPGGIRRVIGVALPHLLRAAPSPVT